MKVKELIRRLQEADPTGEREVCIPVEEDNHKYYSDIWFVQDVDYNEAGPHEELVRDEKMRPYFDIVGGIYTDTPFLLLNSHPLRELLWDLPGPDTPVEVRVTDDARKKCMQEEVDKWRQDGKLLVQEVEKTTTWFDQTPEERAKMAKRTIQRWGRSYVDFKPTYDGKVVAREWAPYSKLLIWPFGTAPIEFHALLEKDEWANWLIFDDGDWDKWPMWKKGVVAELGGHSLSRKFDVCGGKVYIFGITKKRSELDYG